MIEPIQSVLESALLRTLQVDPSLRPSAAIARVDSLLRSVPYLVPDSNHGPELLRSTAARMRRRGVLNPTWLSRHRNIHLYYYLVRAQAGWRQFLENQARSSEHTAYFFLYGDWDALISLHGVEEEATTLLERITATTPYEWLTMTASQVLLFHRLRTREPRPGERLVGDTTIDRLVNGIVDDYDDARFAHDRERFEAAGILLGSTWQLDPSPATDIGAYVGINARGPLHNLGSSDLLDELLRDEVVRGCLVHFMELDRAKPFQYLARVSCGDLDELTRATDAMVARRLGRVTLETTTFIIARSVEPLPLVGGQKSPNIVTPDTRGLESIAQSTLGRLGASAIASFNGLDSRLQPVVLDSLYELQDRMVDGAWDAKTGEDLHASVQLFTQAVLEGAPPGSLHGPVINVARIVEGAFKDALYRVIRRVYDRDLARAQTELKLRSGKIHQFALGNVVATLRTIRDRGDFAFVADALDDEWLDRLEQFADARNRWAHAGRQATVPPRVEIGEARQMFNSGIDLVRWLHESVLPAVDGRRGPPALTVPSGPRQFGVFISHATDDAPTVRRIASRLQELDYPVWYADWAIRVGESITGKISDALGRMDTLLVVLSRRSVESGWVGAELGAALMDQLGGQDVAVVPVLIETCQVPAVLRSIKYIDMRADRFDLGLDELSGLLGERKLRHGADGRRR